MAQILNKDPVTYERERDNFIRELHHFHETRGTAFKKSPKISGQDIDLYLLYVLVTAHGGWIKVNTRNEWSALCEQFHLPGGCVNSGVGLKQIYLRYLDRYEKVHFLGEDGQQADDDDEDSRHRKWSARALHSVPLTYNYHQHNVAESLRDYNGLSADLYKPSNYDKLALSLLSPLPNEQDFAINVCTLLSNEGKHTLRLDKYPRLVNILLAHAGVFDCPGTRQLFIEVYSRVRNYSINSFWSDVLDSQDVIDLTDERIFMKKPTSHLNTFSRRKTLEKEKLNKTSSQESELTPMDVDVLPQDCSRLEASVSPNDESPTDQNQNSIKFEDDDKDLFCVGRTLGTQDPYGQRVLQIASILRNLSFTPENAAVLGRNRCFLRFVMLCVRARWSNLHQLGFDILGNVANEIILKEAGERITDAVLSCVAKGVDSQDRFIVISCLEILNKVSQQDSNEEIVTYGLDDQVYELICRFLALSDIALLVYTLECLYALTSLGERPCTSVARVRGAIDTLVALVTVEAQSYGPKACILMRVVETVSTIAAASTQSAGQSTPVSATTTARASTPTPAPPTPIVSVPSTPTPIVATPAPISPAPSRPSTPATPVTKVVTHKAVETTTPVHHPVHAHQQVHGHQQVIQENEQFALGWLKANFEIAPTVRIEQEELYKKYLGCCTKIGRRGVIAPLHFPKCVRSVFGGTIGPNPLKGETTGTQYYEGIRVRANPAPVTYPSQNAVGTNTITLPSINTTPVKVAQRQQQQRLLQQQLSGVIQPAAPAATPATILIKAPVNSKPHKPTIATIPARKIQRVNGAKVIVTNNCEKTEVNDNENNSQTVTSTVVVSTMTENHISSSPKVCRPPHIAVVPANKINQRVISTPLAEDSDSTNNSLASSSGIGGSRDCSGVGAEEENSLTSFEGILLNGAPSSLDMDAQEDGSSKDSSSVGSKDKPLQTMMLADLLERKVDKEPIMNGVLGKNSINEEGMDLVENHIKKVLKESPTDATTKIKPDVDGINVIQSEVSDDALIEAPRGMKRRASEVDDIDVKKPKYSNGTTSPDPAVDSTTVESTVSSIKSEDQDDDKATVSSTAANLYAALAADCIDDETDIEESSLPPPPPPIKEEPPAIIKEEPRTFINQVVQHHQPQPQVQPQQQQHPQQQQQQQLIVTGSRQIVVQQAIQSNNQILIPSAQMKVRPPGSQPQVLLQQNASGQIQYVVSGGVPGQNYVLAQSQTALVQGQGQTLLVAQTTQQQGTGAKTIIILQPQSAGPPNTQKMLAMTPQGQQVVVTQVPRPLLQSSAIGNIPPPLVPTSVTIPQTSIIVNSSVAQSNPNTVTVTIPTMQQCPVTTSVPSRVVTPTPASTPPPTRPTTPHQAAATHGLVAKQSVKVVKSVSSSTSTEPVEAKPSTSQQMTESKTITIKIDPNAFLCEWRGCLRQFKTPHEVWLHVCEVHCPTNGEEILCLWASCDGLKRRRFSLMTHLFDRHCHSETMCMRRKQLTVTGKTEVSTSTPPTPHHPGYAPNAAFHAIKRHALEFVNPKELIQRPTKPAAAISSSSSPRPGQNPPPEQDDNEGPVTKSIRLTAALILRNLVIYSAHGRRHLRAYEPHLAGVALSNVESSRTIAQVLYDMNDQSNSTHR